MISPNWNPDLHELEERWERLEGRQEHIEREAIRNLRVLRGILSLTLAINSATLLHVLGVF